LSNIEWTDETWNPVIGCTPVSPGCLNCYAATMARRLEAMGRPEYAPRVEAGSPESEQVPFAVAGDRTIRIAEVRGGRAVFTGEVRTLPDRLLEPLRWRKPRRVFVNSMSDLFHEAVPLEFIARVFAIMGLASWHTFQVLTKRPDRMEALLNDDKFAEAVHEFGEEESAFADAVAESYGYFAPEERVSTDWRAQDHTKLPLPNVWLGVSVENQEQADKRIPALMKCPAALRFLSCEPMLGAVDLSNCLGQCYCNRCGYLGKVDDGPGHKGTHYTRTGGRCRYLAVSFKCVHWVIVGGESGGGARPCNVEWIRSIVNQCKVAGVPCFMKQLGAMPVLREAFDLITHHGEVEWPEGTCFGTRPNGPHGRCVLLDDAKGGAPSEWPEDLRVREMPSFGGGAA